MESAAFVYYIFAYIFTLSYFMKDEKDNRVLDSIIGIILFSALVCIWAFPIVLSCAAHKIVNNS